MKLRIYAIVGQCGYVSGEFESPDGHVEMSEVTPSPNHVAKADGTWIEKIPVPQVVSKAQAVLALSRANIWPAFDEYMNAADTPVEHKLAWANINEVHRDSQMLAEVAVVLELTDADIDDLFIAASQIKV